MVDELSTQMYFKSCHELVTMQHLQFLIKPNKSGQSFLTKHSQLESNLKSGQTFTEINKSKYLLDTSHGRKINCSKYNIVQTHVEMIPSNGDEGNSEGLSGWSRKNKNR